MNKYDCWQFFLHSLISAWRREKKNIQTVKVSLFTCVKITEHELPASFSSSHFSPLHRDSKAVAPICSHPECNCAIWLWFLYHVPPCSALPVNRHWPLSNLQVSQAFGELPGDKVLFHKSARYIFQLIRCTRDGSGRGRMDWMMQKIHQGATSTSVYWDCKHWYAACLIPLLFLSPVATWFMVPTPHSRVGVKAEWAAIMWNPRCINNSSRRWLSDLITLNQTNVDKRWGEREGRGGEGWSGGIREGWADCQCRGVTCAPVARN